jgi:anti-sigma factor RsiW
LGQEGKKVMSCNRIENKILGYVDGRLKESERLEVEKHLAACAVCRLRVNEFRAVSGLLDELPVIEPSAAFDLRVHARVAAEPVKQSWWAWFTPSPRVAFAASLLLLATIWIGTHSNTPQPQIAQDDIPVLENYDVISNFEPLTELPQPVQAEDAAQPNQTM